jgi:small subunit ribosomal protein S20
VARALSSLKRLRQNAKRAARNKIRRSRIKTQSRIVLDAMTSGDAAASEKAYRELARVLDRSANRKTIHANTAARRKSRLAKRLNRMKAAGKK